MPDQGHGPARRGRKDPELQAALELEAQQSLDEADEQVPDEPLLFDGDIVTCKITHEVEHGRGPTSFISYGVTSRVQPGEEEIDTFTRVGNQVLARAGEMVEAAVDQYQELQNIRKNKRINHQS